MFNNIFINYRACNYDFFLTHMLIEISFKKMIKFQPDWFATRLSLMFTDNYCKQQSVHIEN
jgi:hypothetical protein